MLLGLSRQMFVILGIEAILLTITLVLLSPPEWLAGKDIQPKAKYAILAGGLVFLCITFFWSFVVGCIVAMNHLSVRI